jgi:hypothetical protein
MSAGQLIYLAVEDDLSEAVVRRILSLRDVRYIPQRWDVGGGYSFLKRKAAAFNDIAKAVPVFLLTDLDRAVCPSALVKEWLGAQTPNPNFIFRVAVREVEAWLLADDAALCRFLKLRRTVTFGIPENEADPKAKMLELAEGSPSRVVKGGVVRRNADGLLQQGPVYNAELSRFTNGDWDVSMSAGKCPSLQRLLRALDAFEKRLRLENLDR